jgi:hypothetical protein
MDTPPGTIWGREPAMVLALVQAGQPGVVRDGYLRGSLPRTPTA